MQELKRKGIHLSSIWIALVLYIVPKPLALILAGLLLGGMVLIDVLRLKGHLKGYLPQVFREHELSSFCGATYMMLSTLICYIIFPDYVFLTAMLILIIADSMAAIIGQRWGRYFIYEKTWEGVGAFLVSALLIHYITAIFTGHNSIKVIVVGSFSCVFATIAELIAKKIKVDDNLLIPLVYGCAFCVMMKMF